MRIKVFLFVPCLVLLLTTLAAAASIVDSEQRTLVFSQPFKRIISLYPAHTTNLLELGLNREIIACGPGDSQLSGRPVVQFQDDPERLLALKPDLVLIRPMISRGYPNLVRILEKNNVRVVSLQPTAASELFTYWETLGRLTGREQQGKAMVETFTKRMAAITEPLRKIPKEKRKRVYFEAIHRQMKTFAPSSIAMFVLESAGGVNIATDAEQVRETNIAAYGKERILAKAARIDLYLAQSGRMNPVSVNDIVKEPGFEVIKAVRDNQVFLVDEEMVSRPTMNLLDGIGFVRSLLYPDYGQEGLSRL
ncbi:MAG: ABC transporter substrate-binding protein [Desulfobulbus sp.]|jgi:iron complex transport system substrate-binding protein|uniref:ABC transporter substrate-binding protein n=1 Tax=Desulfobulbus sp. TaxID=895 RepID=UPI00283B915C|nr:ABC transporter substrate-binding protein [Desulfobulbus sp.]MDR2549713.1 ABC transporter substrate-binding protein [Desulfobulbus sp.]